MPETDVFAKLRTLLDAANALEKLDLSGVSCGRVDAQRCAPCNEMTALDKKIEGAASTLRDLVRHRLELKTKRNHYHDPLVKSLPVEVLSRIFIFCHPYYPIVDDLSSGGHFPILLMNDGRPSRFCMAPMILASVCRPWREIVEATPRLWTELPINLTRYAINPYLTFIDRWLSRSGGLGLTLAICGDAWAVASAADQQFLAPARLIRLINTYSSRWEMLDIYVSNCFLRQFRFSARKEPRLKSLRIHPRPGPLSDNDDLTFNTGADANSILHPKNVFLSRISPNSVGIAWNHVVRADIGGITAFDYLSLLATSPKLISLRICALKDNEGQGTQSFGPHPVTHSALEILNLTTIAQNIDALLNHITLPSLQKLVANSLTTGLTSMIARSAPPLTDLTIGNAESSGEVISLLKMMPNLNDLRLLDTQIGTWFFQYLASTSTFSTSPSEDEDERFLPNLSSLKIRGQLTLLWSYVEDLFGLIPKLNGQDVDGQMQIRRPLTKLSIEIKPVVPMVVGYYKTEVVDEETLRQLRTAGISLEIYDYQGNFLTGTNGGESGKEGQR